VALVQCFFKKLERQEVSAVAVAKKRTRSKAGAKRSAKGKTARKMKAAAKKAKGKAKGKPAAKAKARMKAKGKAKAAPKMKAKAAPKAKSKRKPNPAFMKPLVPDEALAAVVGPAAVPRTEITKKLWAYIKKNGLQDSVNRRNINADEKLQRIFNGRRTVSMFEMTKLVAEHLS
jgi:chromatin remodeling complex protein RSC6